MIEIVKAPKAKRGKHGRPRAGTFPFPKEQTDLQRWTQRLRSKHVIPIVGLSPPQWPDDKLETKNAFAAERQKLRFAEFVSVLFQKWDLTTGLPAAHSSPMLIDTFLKAMKSSSRWIQRRKYHLITNFMKRLRVPKDVRDALDHWRFDEADVLEDYRERWRKHQEEKKTREFIGVEDLMKRLDELEKLATPTNVTKLNGLSRMKNFMDESP